VKGRIAIDQTLYSHQRDRTDEESPHAKETQKIHHLTRRIKEIRNYGSATVQSKYWKEFSSLDGTLLIATKTAKRVAAKQSNLEGMMRFPHVTLRKRSTDPCRFHQRDYSLSLQGIDQRNPKSRIYNMAILNEKQHSEVDNKARPLPLCSSPQGATCLANCLLPSHSRLYW
jgi:hypothetical protein